MYPGAGCCGMIFNSFGIAGTIRHHGWFGLVPTNPTKNQTKWLPSGNFTEIWKTSSWIDHVYKWTMVQNYVELLKPQWYTPTCWVCFSICKWVNSGAYSGALAHYQPTVDRRKQGISASDTVHVCTYVCMHACMCMYVHMRVYVYVYAYAYAYVYVYVYVHQNPTHVTSSFSCIERNMDDNDHY